MDGVTILNIVKGATISKIILLALIPTIIICPYAAYRERQSLSNVKKSSVVKAFILFVLIIYLLSVISIFPLIWLDKDKYTVQVDDSVKLTEFTKTYKINKQVGYDKYEVELKGGK